MMDGLRRIKELQGVLVDVEVSPQGRGYGDGVQRDGIEKSQHSEWTKITMPFEIFLEAFIEARGIWLVTLHNRISLKSQMN